MTPGPAGRSPVEDVTLFGHWICPYSVRVSFALAERDVPHAVVDVPPTAARPRGYVVPEEFVANSPLGEIPLVRIGEEYRADSLPVLEWLEERIAARPLLPADRDGRARVRTLMAWIDAEVFAPMIGVYYGTRPDTVAAASARLATALVALGDRLDDGPWLAGPGPTLAEATVVPFYVRLEGLRRLGFDDPVDPRVADHRARTLDLPGGRAVAWSAEQTDEFAGRFERYRARRHAARTTGSDGS